MLFDLDQITKIKNQLEQATIHNIISYAQRTYPNECCGFILQNGAVQPAHNIIETLYDKSLTSKEAFLIDNESWQIASNRESPIAGIYHSHTNGISDMSDADRNFLRWQDIYYVIVALVDFNPVSAKLFWWEQDSIKELNIKI